MLDIHRQTPFDPDIPGVHRKNFGLQRVNITFGKTIIDIRLKFINDNK